MTSEENRRSIRGRNKRNALLQTAWEVFSEQGYQSASMDMVVAKAGGSKQTLYNYFKSKEDLLRAVLDGRREEVAEKVYRSFEKQGDFVASMWDFSVGLIDTTINSDMIELYRIAIAESKTLALGEWMYELCFVGSWKMMSDYLEQHIPPQKLLAGNGWTAAMHLRGLLEGDLVMRRLCGVMNTLTPPEIHQIVHPALEAFFRIYTPDHIPALTEHAKSMP